MYLVLRNCKKFQGNLTIALFSSAHASCLFFVLTGVRMFTAALWHSAVESIIRKRIPYAMEIMGPISQWRTDLIEFEDTFKTDTNYDQPVSYNSSKRNHKKRNTPSNRFNTKNLLVKQYLKIDLKVSPKLWIKIRVDHWFLKNVNSAGNFLIESWCEFPNRS